MNLCAGGHGGELHVKGNEIHRRAIGFQPSCTTGRPPSLGAGEGFGGVYAGSVKKLNGATHGRRK